jgi:hypothetical protein
MTYPGRSGAGERRLRPDVDLREAVQQVPRLIGRLDRRRGVDDRVRVEEHSRLAGRIHGDDGARVAFEVAQLDAVVKMSRDEVVAVEADPDDGYLR